MGNLKPSNPGVIIMFVIGALITMSWFFGTIIESIQFDQPELFLGGVGGLTMVALLYIAIRAPEESRMMAWFAFGFGFIGIFFLMNGIWKESWDDDWIGPFVAAIIGAGFMLPLIIALADQAKEKQA